MQFEELAELIRMYRGCKVLAAEEERRLVASYQETQNVYARNQLIQGHILLVIKIAHSYRMLEPGYNGKDLVQEGILGLIRSLDRYNLAKGIKLSTYASYWIRAFILHFIVQNKGQVKFATSEAARKMFFKLGKEYRVAFMRNGEAPTIEDLAQTLGVDVSLVEDCLPRIVNRDPSLNAPQRGTDSRLLSDFTVDERANVERIVGDLEEKSVLGRAIKEALRTLEKRERSIIIGRFLHEKALTLREIGSKYGLSRERIRQIEAGALLKIRRSLRRQGIDVPRIFSNTNQQEITTIRKETKKLTKPRRSVQPLEAWAQMVQEKIPEIPGQGRVIASGDLASSLKDQITKNYIYALLRKFEAEGWVKLVPLPGRLRGYTVHWVADNIQKSQALPLLGDSQ